MADMERDIALMEGQTRTKAEFHRRMMLPFPQEATKQRKGPIVDGVQQWFTYVDGPTAKRRLIDATANDYEFRIISQQIIHPASPHLKIDIATGEQVFYNGKPVIEYPTGLVICHGELTCYVLNDLGQRIALGPRADIGTQKITQGWSGVGEEQYKGAATDCLKRCATLFGMALDLYGPDLEAGETEYMYDTSAPGGNKPRTNQQTQQPKQNAPRSSSSATPAAPAPAPGGPGKATPGQIKAIEDLATKMNVSHDKLIGRIKDGYGVESIEEMGEADARAFIGLMQESKKRLDAEARQTVNR